MDIALKSYEKSSFYRFFAIFITVFLLLFLALSSLYYFKERSRLFQEEKVKNRLKYSECVHMQKLLDSTTECSMALIENVEGLDNTVKEIIIAFATILLLILPAAYVLALISLRPMRDSIETIDSFINGIVHDINTPLSIIKLNAQSLSKALEKEKNREKNSRILQGIEAIESLEEQLLFSLQSDRYILKTSVIEMVELLKDRLHFYNDVREGVVVELKSIASLHVKVDRAVFIRMIDNIVLNAIKFSPRNSKVHIELNDTFISVKDNGIGIKKPKEVFGKYYRETRNIKGLGLGLYIVQSVANLHQLRLEIQSSSTNGTLFLVYLDAVRLD